MNLLTSTQTPVYCQAGIDGKTGQVGLGIFFPLKSIQKSLLRLIILIILLIVQFNLYNVIFSRVLVVTCSYVYYNFIVLNSTCSIATACQLNYIKIIWKRHLAHYFK